MRGRDIVVISQQPWDTEIGSNCKNIVLEFSRYNRVLYINSPLDRITVIRQKGDKKVKARLDVVRGKKDGLVQVQDNLWNLNPNCIVESLNWIKNDHIYDFFNSINNRKLSRSIKKALKRLDFKDYLLFNDNEIFKAFYLKDYLKPKLSIYYSRDYMIGVDYWKTHGEVLEPKLIAKSDVCVANSVFLKDYCEKYNKNSFYVGQGCDVDVFSYDGDVVPEALQQCTRPMIGYIGALQSIRLDLEVIREIALKRPDWTVVLVGPEDEVFKNSDLHTLKNVIFTGGKPYEDLPLYLNQFDVAINPQLVNNITIGNYPRKIDEYLAMGKPVVATLTKAMTSFQEYVYLAKDKDEYVALIERALQENSAALALQRKVFARNHTWEASVEKIYTAIEQVETTKR